MLRDILLMTNGGLLLFSKKFSVSSEMAQTNIQPKMLSGLLTAMLTFSKEKMGVPVSCIEFHHFSLTLSTELDFGITCALIFDIKDGLEFGQVITRQILKSFIQTYYTDIIHGNFNINTFQTFNVQLGEIMKSCLRPVMDEFHQTTRGIICCALLINHQVYYTLGELDKVALLANITNLMEPSQDILTQYEDNLHSLQYVQKKTIIELHFIETINSE